ncbi:YihY family inner membrane protein [Sulfurimonas sp.]|uniref:YihY family inner membrane protein n=1 Tax=Sulfurimonas sp. TaxID=2022749 RepID=UPI003D11B2F6
MKLKAQELYKQVKLFVLSFVDKELTLFAASLSFYTIFTIIPLLIIMMSLLTSLPSFQEHYESIKTFIFSNLVPVQSEMIIEKIDGFLENSAKMGIMSLAAVLVASLLFFKNFEYIANRIFHAKSRGLWESITTYWTMMTLTPIGLGISFYITGKIATLMGSNELTSSLNILPLIPYIIIWGLFFLIFQIGPNAKVDPKASAVSSFIVSVIFSFSKNGFIYYVFLNKSYTTMYGSFAIVMFLFLWIYVSWIIFLYGLKLCQIIDTIYKNKKSKEIEAVKEETVKNTSE